MASKKLSGGKSSSSSKGGQEGGYSTDKDVIILEDGNFDKVLMQSEDAWFVEFYAPWCGHCKSLEPEWNKMAAQLKDSVKVAKVDATVHTQLASRFGIQGFPTI